MERLSIQIGLKNYHIEPSIHEGMFTILDENQSALIGKGEDGEWELMLPTTEARDIPVKEIGARIDSVLRQQAG